MTINKKLLVTIGLLSAVAFMAMAPAEPKEEGFKNLKVLPKNITNDQMHAIMEEWEHALGTRCSFCHVRNEETKKMDWANDAKPEKQMARHMFKMTAALNKKYFGAKKDSLGMVIESGINCNTCHRGTSHPEVVRASATREKPAGPPPTAKPAEGTPPAQGSAPTPPPNGGRE